MTNIIIAIGIVLGILGAIFVSQGLPLNANIVFLLSDFILIYHNYRIGEKHQALMFTIYGFIAIYGIINLSGVI